jgi:hypothetical protein
VTRSGETLVGREAIRKVLGSMMQAKTQFHSRVVRAVTLGDTAHLYRFRGNDDRWLGKDSRDSS